MVRGKRIAYVVHIVPQHNNDEPYVAVGPSVVSLLLLLLVCRVEIEINLSFSLRRVVSVGLPVHVGSSRRLLG